MAKFWHKTNNNQSYTLEHWYGESRLWQKAVWLESKSLYVTKFSKFSIELTAASITRLQFSEWYGTSKQKFKLFIFLFNNNCYKVALCTPLYAWHGHVAPRHINWASDAMVIVASNTCCIWIPDLSPNSVWFGWPEYRKVPRSIPPGGMTFSLLGLSLGWKIPFPPGEFWVPRSASLVTKSGWHLALHPRLMLMSSIVISHACHCCFELLLQCNDDDPSTSHGKQECPPCFLSFARRILRGSCMARRSQHHKVPQRHQQEPRYM
jgi:hypothetical protein